MEVMLDELPATIGLVGVGTIGQGVVPALGPIAGNVLRMRSYRYLRYMYYLTPKLI